MNIDFGKMRSPEIEDFAKNKGIVLVPIGACEEHGRHLPVITDTEMAYRASIDAANIIKGEVAISVLPAVWFGYTVAMLKNWAGTITIRPKVLIDLLYDICKSLIDMDINRILIINGHGNNPGVLDVVVRSIGDDLKIFPGIVNIFSLWDKEYVKKNRKSKIGGIGHACEIETSVMLYLTDLVNMDVADDTDIMKTDFKTCPVDFASEKKKQMYLSTWYLENSTYGGAGDPSCSTKEFGKNIHNMTVENLVQIIRKFNEINNQLEKRTLNRKCKKF